MTGFSEADWEQLALDTLGEHEWQELTGTQIAPGVEGGRQSWTDIVLPDRMLAKMRDLNPQVPAEYLDQARTAIIQPQSQDAIAENYRIHQMLVQGYRGITYIDADGIEQNPTIRLISHRPKDNEFLAVQQVTVRSTEHQRRFDVVLYLNGMPVVIFELRQAGSAHADIAAAHTQLQTYLREFPMAFRFTVLVVASAGITARYGTPFTPLEHFAPWNVDDDGRPVPYGEPADGEDVPIELETLIDGLFNTERFLQLLRNFTAFDEDGDGLVKRIAKPHQYFAVTKAVWKTVEAAESNGKAGVVWHTQGSGKSMEMELYAQLVANQPKLKNPTIVVVTDRKELDTQLYETFNRSRLLDESPKKMTKRAELRDELSNRTTGGIYFTTLQKFGLTKEERASGTDHPLLTDRRNIIIVVVDEAHRSHYDDLDGYARHIRDALPNAIFIAFTGTPISEVAHNTREVFGPDIDVYDLTRAVADNATVPVYFEPRLAKVGWSKDFSEDDLDHAVDEATLGLDDVERAQIEKSVAVINAIYGAPERLATLAADIVNHWDARSAEIRKFISSPGKAFIVGATRQICAQLYEEIIKLRPHWHDDSINKGVIKVVYSGSPQDQGIVAKHVRRESQNKAIQERLRDAEDELQIVVVKDMMLTGFDAPPLHTLYLDRPLKGALLMQTLARVNRTFRGKPSGLLVAYAPLAENLAAALAEYTETDRNTKPVGKDIDTAVKLTADLVGQLDQLCAGYDWRSKAKVPQHGWMKAAIGLTAYLRSPSTPENQVPDGEPNLGDRFRKLANHLARAWSLCAGNETVDALRPTIRFYEQVRVWMGKFDAEQRRAEGKPVPEEIKRLLSSLVDESTASGDILDIYDAAGLPKPALSDLGPDYEAKAKAASHPHLAIEALRAVLTRELATATKNNVVRQRAFSDRIADLMRRYTNQQLTSAEVIAELIAMAKEVAAEGNRGKCFTPPLSQLAFYDAVAQNESAVELQGEEVLAQIARAGWCDAA